MVMHAGIPTLETVDNQAEQARLDDLAFLLPRRTSHANISVYRHLVLCAADIVRDRATTHHMGMDLQTSLDGLKRAVLDHHGHLGLTIPSQAIRYDTRAQQIVNDYGVGGSETDTTLMIPTAKITGVGALALHHQPNDPNPVLDLRVQTSLSDETPIEYYTLPNEPVKQEPHPGGWHRFPLDLTSITAMD